eukprot:scaffold307585_cov71-Attheya_sp.AAC.1
MKWSITHSSTNNDSIQCTLDVILVLFLILVVQVIDALWHCDSRFSEGRVMVSMKCIYDGARDRGMLEAYRTVVPAGCGRLGRAGGRTLKVIYDLARSRYSGRVQATTGWSSSPRAKQLDAKPKSHKGNTNK